MSAFERTLKLHLVSYRSSSIEDANLVMSNISIFIPKFSFQGLRKRENAS